MEFIHYLHRISIFNFFKYYFRCHINGCDNIDRINAFEPNWLVHSVPYKNGRPANCLKFTRIFSNSSIFDNCTIDAFDRSKIDACDGEYVYKTNDVTILNEVNILIITKFTFNVRIYDWLLKFIASSLIFIVGKMNGNLLW